MIAAARVFPPGEHGAKLRADGRLLTSEMAQANFNLDFDVENDGQKSQNDKSPEQKRFKVVGEEERNRIMSGLTSENTKKVTQKSVLLLDRFFRHNAQEQSEALDLATIPSSNLCLLLSQFWLSLRTEKGEYYKANSLQNIRHGINRRIKELKREFDIIKSPEFAESNTAFKAQMKELKRTGKADTTHHEPLSEADLSKVYSYFNVSRM